ncbi:hypothetical protein WJX77_011495 [Trebouxia sp. C0004]
MLISLDLVSDSACNPSLLPILRTEYSKIQNAVHLTVHLASHLETKARSVVALYKQEVIAALQAALDEQPFQGADEQANSPEARCVHVL